MRKFLFFLLLIPSAHAAFNVVYDDAGNLRPAYETWAKLHGADALYVDPKVAAKLSLSPLEDKVKIYGVPFIIDSTYDGIIKPGTEQRAKALRLFFYDLFIGERAIFKSEKFRGNLTPTLVNSVLRQNNQFFNIDGMREFYAGKTLEDINFMYGPDVLGDKVIEDNVGYLGGMVDAHSAEEAFVEAKGLPRKLLEPEPFLEGALRKFFAEKNISPERSAATFFEAWLSEDENTPKKLTVDETYQSAHTFHNGWFTGDDHEYNRLANLLRRMNIPIVKSDGSEAIPLFQKMSAGELDFVFDRAPPEKWKEYVHYVSAIRTNPKLQLFPSMGTGMLSNKAFLPDVENMIRFYLGEEPILRTARTFLLTQPKQLTDFATSIGLEIDFGGDGFRQVLKYPDGAQGSNVAILSKMTPNQRGGLVGVLNAQARLLETMGLEHFGAPLVVQDEVAPSFIPVAKDSWLNLSLGIRPLTVVLGRQITVRARPWGRGVFQLGHSLDNVSRGAFEVPVFRHEECERLLR